MINAKNAQLFINEHIFPLKHYSLDSYVEYNWFYDNELYNIGDYIQGVPVYSIGFEAVTDHWPQELFSTDVKSMKLKDYNNDITYTFKGIIADILCEQSEKEVTITGTIKMKGGVDYYNKSKSVSLNVRPENWKEMLGVNGE